MKKSYYCSLLFLTFFGCDEADTETTDLRTPTNAVEVRITNTTNFDFEEVILMTQEVGTVLAGESSSFYVFDTAYEYGYVKAMVDGKEYVAQPTDFVGETPLGPGQYSYLVSIFDDTTSPGTLNTTFEVFTPLASE
ncbi:MAG: hypothetical protein AAFU57_15920 [Bacteroidota bacterium]